VERWRTARLKAGKAPSTVNRDLAGLRSALTSARVWKFLATNPLQDVKPSRVDTTGIVRYLNADEETRLRAALTARDEDRRQSRTTANEWRRARGYAEYPDFGTYADHLNPMVLLAMHTGCRRGELFGLRWRDLNLGAALLTVRSESAKSGKARVIPLNTEIASVLKTWRPSVVSADALVFPGVDGAPLVDVKTAFTQALTAAGIADFRFHDLRHSFASKLVQAGIDLNTVRELLGHADLKMTLRYAHLAPEHKAAAVERLVAR